MEDRSGNKTCKPETLESGENHCKRGEWSKFVEMCDLWTHRAEETTGRVSMFTGQPTTNESADGGVSITVPSHQVVVTERRSIHCVCPFRGLPGLLLAHETEMAIATRLP